LVELASRHTNEPVVSEDLARTLGFSVYMVAAVLASLRRAGLLLAHKGPAGGYRFRKPPDQIFVSEVINIFDGPLLSIGDNRIQPGRSDGDDALDRFWSAARASLAAVLDVVTVADLAAGVLPGTVTLLVEALAESPSGRPVPAPLEGCSRVP
jgi:Rrf2 family protein